MILTDAGPLIALVDRNDLEHQRCVLYANESKHVQMISTWPCFTEAMHLLFAAGDYRFQRELWRMQQAGELVLLDVTNDEIAQMTLWMERYKDHPMDLADASLMAVAEARGYKTVFTLDSDFRIYRMADGSVLEVVP